MSSASIATKCMLQIPTPIAIALAAIHTHRRPAEAAATRDDRSSAAKPASDAITIEAMTRKPL